MLRVFTRPVVLVPAVTLLMLASAALGVPTTRQRAAVNTLKRKAKIAEQQYEQSKFEDAATTLKDIQKEYDELLEEAQKEKDLIPLLESVYSEVLRTHALLELEGIALPPLKKPALEESPSTDGGVSFTKQVAPILVAKCGRCHVDAQRGMFSLATYAGLMKGSEAGVVIFPKDATGSRLIEIIESGDMPRGGLKVAPEELMTLKAWIAEGAKYDGGDPQRRITEFTGNVTPEAAPRLEVTRATGMETVSFSNDIAPILAEKCANCHGNGDRPSGRFDLATFQNMLRGGESGPPIVPKQPAESLLIKKLKGTASGARMPRGQDPLPEDVIAKFEKWIAEGATFDGPDPQQNVVDVAALAKALRSSHEDLAKDREERARKNWMLGLPGVEYNAVSTDNFYLVGNVGPASLGEYGTLAEQVAGKVAELFKIPPSEPLVKGKITLFVLAGRYDYSEFGKMIEQRQLPADWRGHWRFTVVDAYGAIVPTRGDEYSNEALLAQVIAGNYVAANGPVPRWFAEGAARLAASKISSSDPRVAGWDEQLGSVLASMSKPDDFLTGKLAPEQADIAGYRFVRFLFGRDPRRFLAVLRGVKEGQPFNEAFLRAYGGTPSQLTPAWAQAEIRGGRRR